MNAGPLRGVQRRMFAALLLLLPTQVQSQPTCLPSSQGQVCGFHCVNGRNGPACARTAQGQCLLSGGVATCVDPAPPPPPPAAQEPPAPQCVTQGGTTACGYGCLTHNGKAACANTPLGRCEVWQGKLRCFDPPVMLMSLPQAQWKRVTCEHNDDVWVCGYNCKGTGERLACAQTWFGICENKVGRVTCWDPSEQLIWSTQGDLPAPRCLQSGDAVACGYTCDHNYGEPACTSTPRGRCENAHGKVTCWDPPIPYVPPAPR